MFPEGREGGGGVGKEKRGRRFITGKTRRNVSESQQCLREGNICRREDPEHLIF